MEIKKLEITIKKNQLIIYFKYNTSALIRRNNAFWSIFLISSFNNPINKFKRYITVKNENEIHIKTSIWLSRNFKDWVSPINQKNIIKLIIYKIVLHLKVYNIPAINLYIAKKELKRSFLSSSKTKWFWSLLSIKSAWIYARIISAKIIKKEKALVATPIIIAKYTQKYLNTLKKNINFKSKNKLEIDKIQVGALWFNHKIEVIIGKIYANRSKKENK